MKRISDIFIDGLFFALYMFISCLVSMLAEMFIVRVITLCVGINYFTLCLIRAVIYTIFVNGILCIVSYRSGYKSASPAPISTALSGIFAVVLHFAFCLLFSFEAFCAGGVKFLSAMVKFGTSLSLESFDGQLTRFDCIAVFFINGLIYCVLMAISQYLGAKKRLSDRKEMIGTTTHTQEVNQENL